MHFGRHVLSVIIWMTLLFASVSGVVAQCVGGGAALQVSGTVNPTLANYNPFSTAPQSQSFSFTVVNTAETECLVSVAYMRTGALAMSNGSGQLSYDIVAGGASIVSSDQAPAPANRLDLTLAANNGSATVTYSFEVPDSQMVSAGSYLDTSISLEFLSREAAGTLIGNIKSIPASVSDFVANICDIPTPSVTSMNFSSRIVNAVATDQPITLQVPEVRCTTPALIKLTGDAMRQSPSPPPLANLDHFINYRAAATLGSSTVTLTTSEAAGSDTATSVAPTAGQADGVLDLSVELVPGRRIQAGSYSAVLTLEVIPEF